MKTKRISVMSTFVLFLATSAAMAADPLTGTGCVSKGVESGCLVVKDLKQKAVYNVFFKDKKPEIGTGISFQAQPHAGMTMCMQGRAVDVTQWKPIKLQCPQDEAAPKK